MVRLLPVVSVSRKFHVPELSILHFPLSTRIMTPLEKLKALAAWETEPILTETEVEDVLGNASVADSEGNAPANDDWTPTYDINKAAAEAWLIKAARASALTEIDPPESGIVTSQVFENCMKLSREFKTKVNSSISVKS